MSIPCGGGKKKKKACFIPKPGADIPALVREDGGRHFGRAYFASQAVNTLFKRTGQTNQGFGMRLDFFLGWAVCVRGRHLAVQRAVAKRWLVRNVTGPPRFCEAYGLGRGPSPGAPPPNPVGSPIGVTGSRHFGYRLP